ncbi:phosphotransferase [Pseudactinotalea sp.]|uniref:phosphotransferase n=1 Tax=Pseudactinotalea sp. TaxID=1926260 RepID=UPI003B3B2EDC
MQMHENQSPTDVTLARRLLAEQHPRWADLPLTPIEHFGTDHDVYRIGEQASLRLPRTAWAAAQARKEDALLPRLAPRVTLAVPQVFAHGHATSEFPHPWSVQSWLPGEDLVGRVLDGDTRLARDLAAFVGSLREVDIADAPPRPATARGGYLGDGDTAVENRLQELGDRVNAAALVSAWGESRGAAAPTEQRWTHGDLLPGNLLTTDGRLSGVIDFGALNVTDPALDLTPCWYLLGGADTPAGRAFLGDLGATPEDVLRARGWAQLQALNALPYYWDTNPGMVRLAGRALRLIEAEVTPGRA